MKKAGLAASRRLTAARWAALAAVAVAAAAVERPRPAPLDMTGYVEGGEALLHGIPALVTFRMPLGAVLAALISHHALEARAQTFVVAAQAVLLLASCALLGAAAFPASFTALVLLAGAGLFPVANYPESFYAALVLLAAAIMIWRAREPSRANAVLLALALGATLLFRSPLSFFPPLLALFEYARAPRPRARGRLADALILGVVPYAFLLPWLRLNWLAHHALVPFEYAAADSNIVTGALGLVKTVEGPWENLLPRPLAAGESLLRWAAGEVARHPIRYLAAVARRVLYVLSLHPGLAAAGALALWWRRRERAFQQLGLLAAYYLGVHCLMTVLPRYFDPLWPLLAVAAAAAAWLSLEREPAGAPARWARAVPAAAMVPVLILCALTERIVASYAPAAAMTAPEARARALELLDRAAASSPDDAWLLLQRGKRKAALGDLAGASDDFSRALAARPGDPRLSLELARARALRGDDGELAGWRDPAGAPEDVRFDARVYQANAALRRGRLPEARERLLAAKKGHEATIFVNEPATSRDSAVESELRSSDSGFLWRAYALLNERPEAERLQLLSALEPMVRTTARLRIEQAYLALRANDRAAAVKRLEEAGRSDPTEDDGLRIASLYREMKDFRRSLELLKPLLERRPGDSALWTERAELEARAGNRGEALASLARAEALGSANDGQRRRIIKLYGELEERSRALALLKPLLARRPGDMELWLERAELEARTGEPAAARASLARAAALEPADEEQRRRLVDINLELEEYGRARGLLEPMLRRGPRDAGLWLASAELEARAGERNAALASLARAEGLKAASGDQDRRIIRLYGELREYRRALALLEPLLARRPGDRELRLERAELEARSGARTEALASLARVEPGSLAERERLRAARLYRELGDYGRARALLTPILETGGFAARLERAELEAQAGEREGALKSLALAEDAKPDDDGRRRIVALHKRLKDFRGALAALRPLLESRPEDAWPRLEGAELEAEAGEKAAALKSLAGAEALKPDGDARRRMALLYRRLEEPARALELLKGLPEDAELLLERAELQAKTGARADALLSLSRVEGLSAAGDEQRRRAALGYQSLGEHGRAVAVYDGLIKRHPREGAYFSDRGLCLYLKGDAAAAIRDLETAIKLEPAFIPAYLTLGAIHAANGRRERALEVYDAGLAGSSNGDAALRKALLDARKASAGKAR